MDQLANKLRAALRRETTNMIEIGGLLLKSRKMLAHGKWQDWLDEHFNLSYQTALNYCAAAEYVASKSKSQTVGHFASLSPIVLYTLAAGCTTQRRRRRFCRNPRGARRWQARHCDLPNAQAASDG